MRRTDFKGNVNYRPPKSETHLFHLIRSSLFRWTSLLHWHRKLREWRVSGRCARVCKTPSSPPQFYWRGADPPSKLLKRVGGRLPPLPPLCRHHWHVHTYYRNLLNNLVTHSLCLSCVHSNTHSHTHTHTHTHTHHGTVGTQEQMLLVIVVSMGIVPEDWKSTEYRGQLFDGGEHYRLGDDLWTCTGVG